LLRRTVLLISLLLAFPIWGQGNTERASVQRMVKGFYQWYVPLMLKGNPLPASTIALRKKASLFSTNLRKALMEDYAAAKNSPGEIVGIDWDPFLDTQDPENKYVLGEITESNRRFLIKIYGIRDGKRQTEQSVTAVVKKESGRWVFEDFLSPNGEGLLSALKALKKSREKPVK
jgi:hypothetical protein